MRVRIGKWKSISREGLSNLPNSVFNICIAAHLGLEIDDKSFNPVEDIKQVVEKQQNGVVKVKNFMMGCSSAGRRGVRFGFLNLRRLLMGKWGLVKELQSTWKCSLGLPRWYIYSGLFIAIGLPWQVPSFFFFFKNSLLLCGSLVVPWGATRKPEWIQTDVQVNLQPPCDLYTNVWRALPRRQVPSGQGDAEGMPAMAIAMKSCFQTKP